MDPEPSKAQRVAAEVAHVVIRFLKARLGRGPEGFRTYLIDNMILIRLFKVLTPVEFEHAKTTEGRRPLKETRSRLIEDVRPSVEEIIRNSTGARVISLHSDLSAKTGEVVVVFVLDHAIRDLAGT